MTRDIIELNNFMVLIEESSAEKTIVDTCGFDENVIGFAFYGSGNVELEITYGDTRKPYHNTTGIILSYFANSKVTFQHTISYKKPLQCISVIAKYNELDKLPEQEHLFFSEHLQGLLNTKEDFAQGPSFYMTHDMQHAVEKILHNEYNGASRIMFLRSQVTELLSHFFATVSGTNNESYIDLQDRDKLYEAKEIISKNLDAPPSLKELSKQIGLNDYKLKKNFKELFGVPVFKYLQNERLTKAHDLLTKGQATIQEAAWQVGYESLSSFSSAFLKKYGFRPSEIKK